MVVGFFQFLARLSRRKAYGIATDKSLPARRRWPAVRAKIGIAEQDLHLFDRDAEFFCRAGSKYAGQALPHLCGGYANFGPRLPATIDPHFDLGAGFVGSAAAEPGVLVSDRHAPCEAAITLLPAPAKVLAANIACDSVNALPQTDAFAQNLPRRCCPADVECVDSSNFDGVESQVVRERVHIALDGETALRYPETSQCTARRIIRVHRKTIDLDVGHIVGAGSMRCRARQHLFAKARVCAGITIQGRLDRR